MLGFRNAPPLTDDAAVRVADDALTGFAATDVAVDRDARAAPLSDAAGRVVLVRGLGDRWIVRTLERGTAAREGQNLSLIPPDAPRLTLDLGDATSRFAGRLA